MEGGGFEELSSAKAMKAVDGADVRCSMVSSLRSRWNEHGTIYAISSDFGDRMTTQHLD